MPDPEEITFDGYDPDTGTIIDPIRVWKNYQNRRKGVALEVRHGDKARFIKRSGQAVKVRVTLDDGKRVYGWVTFWFIKGFKDNYVKGAKSETTVQLSRSVVQ